MGGEKMTNEQFKKELKSCINRVMSEEFKSKSSSAVPFDEYFTFRDYCQIKGLYYFVNDNKHIYYEDIEEMIERNNKMFTFLSNFITHNKDILYRMHDFGLKYACIASRKQQMSNAQRADKINKSANTDDDLIIK
jgi:hypothetical protein